MKIVPFPKMTRHTRYILNVQQYYVTAVLTGTSSLLTNCVSTQFN